MIEFWLYVGVIAGIYTIFALGLQLQFGVAGIPNFGHAAFMLVAAYSMAFLVIRVGLPLAVASLLAIVIVVGFGLLLGTSTLRLRSDYLAIAMIAAGEIMRYLALNLQEITGGAAGTVNMLGPGSVASYNDAWRSLQASAASAIGALLGFRVSPDLVMNLVVWSVALLLTVAMWYLIRSPWGRVLRALRDDEEAAASLGKPVFIYKLQAFAVGAALAGLAGLFLALELASFTPDDFQPTLTFFAFVIVILGGMTKAWSVPIGALIFALLYSSTRFLDFWPLNYFDSGERAFLRLALVGVVLMLLIAWRPQGLFGSRAEMSLD